MVARVMDVERVNVLQTQVKLQKNAPVHVQGRAGRLRVLGWLRQTFHQSRGNTVRCCEYRTVERHATIQESSFCQQGHVRGEKQVE